MNPAPAFRETAYAKLNLALHVRRRRVDGYHELETLFAFVDAGDELTAEPADTFSLTITGPFADGLSNGDDNLVLRAARMLADRNGIRGGAAFTLEKRLPIAAGIGGGSADAAAALRLLSRMWGLGPDHVRPSDVAADLGADVPACVASQTVHGEGVGEKLTPIDGSALEGLPVLLVNPRVACPTGPVFFAWDGIDRGALDVANWADARNDLEMPAVALHPQIADVLAALQATGPRLARMSGSGATCFALFETSTARDAAARSIAASQTGWWTLAGALR
ncbi:4-(cytidine 5'-diphospho)-2-C-methyl-D-erythritol kinase [Novosphingobium sp. LASN5T]|uniref:4-(cytidine 5'-diphospho)-2-C-methyl-D-erythritol kinase n=1 Tax=unclassified Novosphingobium TaxID=2644732 RepID=UPI000F5DA787|nr:MULTISPECIES: 4-(cytidine 5'-diphospho)-2-C-methyl-D-erythritol kinase [unclassified Novosphingobium]MBF5091876.1 4-(cytidine 5'-diphospho)-2-C-methyl-D-erythritol kinase [Novosphingobium sp. NBM11]RQW43407.1 4-(cytidine 5'-diphospho)-2-C-methyl-D-erythritol kinase [Novosphingobium sp. LASN5T]